MSWASQSFPWGDPGFPILRDTGESKIPPKTGLNTSHPVVLALEISGCSITDPPPTDHFPEMFALCFPVSHSPLQAVQFVFALHQYRGNSEIQDFDQFFQKANEKAFSASGRGCLFQPGSVAL